MPSLVGSEMCIRDRPNTKRALSAVVRKHYNRGSSRITTRHNRLSQAHSVRPDQENPAGSPAPTIPRREKRKEANNPKTNPRGRTGENKIQLCPKKSRARSQIKRPVVHPHNTHTRHPLQKTNKPSQPLPTSIDRWIKKPTPRHRGVEKNDRDAPPSFPLSLIHI